MIRDFVCDEFNRKDVLQVLKPNKSKYLAKNHVPLATIFAEIDTFLALFESL